jgi:hypothetical protein
MENERSQPMERKTPYADPRNAIVTGGATLVVGPGRVTFRGRVKDLDPQAIADAWHVADALRSGEQVVPDVPAALQALHDLQIILQGDEANNAPCLVLVDEAIRALTGGEVAAGIAEGQG